MTRWIGLIIIIAACGSSPPPPPATPPSPPSEVRAGALTAKSEDLDAATLEIMRDEVGCEKAGHLAAVTACAGLAAFATAQKPTFTNEQRLIGVGVAVAADGSADDKLELLAFVFRREQNFHASVELGDSATSVPVLPQSAEEATSVAAAAAAIASGHMPAHDQAIEFARTMDVETKMQRLEGTTGVSVALPGNNRMLVRQAPGMVIVLELARENSHVKGRPFWVQVFRTKV